MLRSTYSAAVSAAVVAGVALGLGFFTFGYARGHSYLTNDPAACANCHIMNEHFDAWSKSSHHAVAACNDCHTPHALLPKYFVKAKNGFWHSFYFTTGRFPDPLRITEGNRRVTEAACRHCHGEITEAIDPPTHVRRLVEPGVVQAGRGSLAQREDSCIRCHTYVGHLVR